MNVSPGFGLALVVESRVLGPRDQETSRAECTHDGLGLQEARDRISRR